MEKLFTSNVSPAEQGRRYAIGAALIMVLLVNSSFPAWIALVACYPIFTALVQWDPINLVFQRILNKTHKNSSAFELNKGTTA